MKLSKKIFLSAVVASALIFSTLANASEDTPTKESLVQ